MPREVGYPVFSWKKRVSRSRRHSDAAEEPLAVGTLLRGRGLYRIVSPIGTGAMGSVYLARVEEQPADEEEELPTHVALKVMTPPEGIRDITPRGEVGLMRTLRHPNIVRLHDWSFDGSLSFSVMDFHERGSLHDHLLARGSLSVARTEQLLRDILAALVAIHSQGMLHLDVKPENVLIGSDDRFLLTDFGISRALFCAGQKLIVGTPAFMSPEQTYGDNAKLDARADLYSLGATVWEAVTCDFSHEEMDRQELVRERRLHSLPALVLRAPAAYAHVAQIVDQLLEFDPRHRPGTAAEMLLRVDELAGDEPPATSSPTAVPPGEPVPEELRGKLLVETGDPVLRALLEEDQGLSDVRLYRDGQIICREEERSYAVYLLLAGQVEILRAGVRLGIESREGEILGEVSALVGTPRTATLRARGETVLAQLNGADLEQTVRQNPAIAVRLVKSLALRLVARDARAQENRARDAAGPGD